jgi:hypothetical protein
MIKSKVRNKKEGAYSFLNQYPTSAVESILVDLSVSGGIVSLQFDLLVNKAIFIVHVQKYAENGKHIFHQNYRVLPSTCTEKGKQSANSHALAKAGSFMLLPNYSKNTSSISSQVFASIASHTMGSQTMCSHRVPKAPDIWILGQKCLL